MSTFRALEHQRKRFVATVIIQRAQLYRFRQNRHTTTVTFRLHLSGCQLFYTSECHTRDILLPNGTRTRQKYHQQHKLVNPLFEAKLLFLRQKVGIFHDREMPEIWGTRLSTSCGYAYAKPVETASAVG